MDNKINEIFEQHIYVAKESGEKLNEVVAKTCRLISECLFNGNKILLFGNGGSASDAQHIAAEFVGRFLKDRKSLAAIALTTDTSAITAIGNDYGFDRIFERQVEGLACKNDVLIGISTSGNSKNVLKALEYGKLNGCITIGMSGNGGGLMNQYCDINIIVPSNVTARIQEMHILIGHVLCSAVDADY